MTGRAISGSCKTSSSAASSVTTGRVLEPSHNGACLAGLPTLNRVAAPSSPLPHHAGPVSIRTLVDAERAHITAVSACQKPTGWLE